MTVEVRRARAGKSPEYGGSNLFEALFESAPDAIVVVDEAGEILLANARTERLLGYTRAELAGKPIELLIPERLRDTHVRHRDRFAGAPATRPMGAGLELVAQHRDGREIPVEVSLSPLATEQG